MKRWLFLYIIFWPLTYGAMFAQFNSIGPDYFQQQHCRQDAAFSAGMALLPPSWVVIPFMTGFWEHGLKFTCKKDEQ